MIFDICVLGGGINGAAIARDAAGRGLSVLLLEARDLAQGTSSASTKLIHGGLRYLEYGAFGLVKESLQERSLLLKQSPHIIWPMDFVLPHRAHMRPIWMMKLGLWLYDHLAGLQNVLPRSRTLDISKPPHVQVIKSVSDVGYGFSDCWVDDSRLVVLNALEAAEKGADIRLHSRCVGIYQMPQCWRLSVQPSGQDTSYDVKASVVVNATGPWVDDLLQIANIADKNTPRVRMVKGSHIIVPRLYEGECSYVLQQDDRRIVFAIPYEGKYTLIGTTEEAYNGDPYAARASKDEIEYMCAAAGQYFRASVTPEHVCWTYSGVRPLYQYGHASMTAAPRDHKLVCHGGKYRPFISLFGGKLTTHRAVAQEAVDKAAALMGKNTPAWTNRHTAHLPGGDIPDGDFDLFVEALVTQYTFLDRDLLYRYARAYGTRVHWMLDGVHALADMGAHYGDNLYAAEVRYMVRHEWARTAEDVLWRRSKLGMHVKDATLTALDIGLPLILAEEGRVAA